MLKRTLKLIFSSKYKCNLKLGRCHSKMNAERTLCPPESLICWYTDLGGVEAARSQPLPPLLLQRLLNLLLRPLLDPLLEGVQLRVESVLVILQYLARPLKRDCVTRQNFFLTKFKSRRAAGFRF
jgi:hypothetical protein